MIVTVSLAGSGFHPAAWQVTPAPSAAAIRAFTERAEQAGIDMILFRPNPWSTKLRESCLVDWVNLDTLPLMAAAIAPTRHVGLAACVTPSEAHPFNVGRIFATLDRLSSGRAAWLALPDPLSPNEDETGRALEFVDLVRKLWDSWEDEGLVLDKASGLFAEPAKVHRVDHAGRWFKARGPLNVPRPIQGQPIIVAVDPCSEKARTAVVQIADLVLLRCTDMAEACSARAALLRLAAGQGRPPRELLVLASVVPVLSNEGAARLDALTNPALLAAMVADRAQCGSDEPGGNASLADAANRAITQQTGLPFVGTPEDLAAMMRTWRDAGACDGFDLCPAVLPDDLDGVLSAANLAAQDARPKNTGTLRERLRLQRPRSRFAKNDVTVAL